MIRIRKNVMLLILVCLLAVVHFTSAKNDEALQLYNIGSRQLESSVKKGSFSEIKEAVKILQRSYEENKSFFNVIQDLARAYYLLGDFENALNYTRRAMELRKEDLSLKVLEVNILIRQNELEVAGPLILELLDRGSYNKGLLFTASLYFSSIGDFINYKRTVDTYRQLYEFSENEEFLHMYTLLDAIDSGEYTPQTQKAARELVFSRPDNVWIMWLLLEYFLSAPNEEISASEIDVQSYVQKLQDSSVPFLRQIAYDVVLQKQIPNKENEQEILDFAKQYTIDFPYSADAWFQRGLILHGLKKYEEALNAFSRALQAQPENSFLTFVFDNTLKKIHSEEFQPQLEKRVATLVGEGRTSLNGGNVTLATEAARRALYISPLAKEPRVLLSDIFTQQGYLLRASTQLDLLHHFEQT